MKKLNSTASFMSLRKGDKIGDSEKPFIALDDTTLAGDIPKVLLKTPEGKNQFFHWDKTKEIVFDDDGNENKDLTGAEVDQAMAS
jgi:hypothetical protein